MTTEGALSRAWGRDRGAGAQPHPTDERAHPPRAEQNQVAFESLCEYMDREHWSRPHWLALWGAHENRALSPAGDRTPDHRGADGARPDRPGVGRRGEQRGRAGRPASAVLPAAGLPPGNPPPPGPDRQAVRREPAPALPRRGPRGRLPGRARARPFLFLG